jgi:uncharacterized protein DUF3551
MLRILAATAMTIAAVVFGLPAAQANEAPWCAVVSTGVGSVHWDCQYRSVAECEPHVVAGNRGMCNMNPYFQASVAPRKHATRRRHSVQQ